MPNIELQTMIEWKKSCPERHANLYHNSAKAYLGPCQTSMIELFCEKVTVFSR